MIDNRLQLPPTETKIIFNPTYPCLEKVGAKGGKKMICPKCGFSGNFVVNGDRFCASCSCFIAKAFPLEPPSIPSLEKIKSLDLAYLRTVEKYIAERIITNKLNEVIEKLNLVMDYLNKGVGK